MKKTQKEAGYTIVEFMIVLACIAVLLSTVAIVAPPQITERARKRRKINEIEFKTGFLSSEMFTKAIAGEYEPEEIPFKRVRKGEEIVNKIIDFQHGRGEYLNEVSIVRKGNYIKELDPTKEDLDLNNRIFNALLEYRKEYFGKMAAGGKHRL